MRKGHSITGLQVLALDTAADMGHVLDLIFDHDANECLGILLREHGMFHAAQVVPWSDIRVIGKNAVMIESEQSVIAPGDDARLRSVMERDTHLSGTKILTETGDEIGSFADVYIDENTGRVIGYETSGGLVSDTMSGKRYIPAEKTGDLHVGDDVLMVAPQTADMFERQAEQEPGGIKGALSSASEKVSDVYSNIADASVEKQQAFVVGKEAGKNVYLPAPSSEAMDTINEDQAMVKAEDGNVENGPLLVAQGDTISAEQAQTATNAGILGTLVTAAGGGVASGLLGSAQSKLGDAQSTASEKFGVAQDSASEKFGAAQGSASEKGGETQENLLQKSIGQPAGTDIDLDDGSTLIVAGMTITESDVERAKATGNEKALIASAGLGTASVKAQQTYDVAADKAGEAWNAVKGKTSELTDSAKEKKSELDDAAQKRKINHALGRPITRIVLSQDDTVILNTGDIITHKAIRMGRDNGVMDVILDSVYDEEPNITPEMARATEPGAAALPSQAEPTGSPITATVTPGQQSQDQPSQGER